MFILLFLHVFLTLSTIFRQYLTCFSSLSPYDQTVTIQIKPLIWLSPDWSDIWGLRSKGPMIIPFPSESVPSSDCSHLEVTSDHTIPIRKRPLIRPSLDRKWALIRPFPSRSDLRSDHSHPQVTYDQTLPIWNQNPDALIIVWEHTVWSEATSGWHLNLGCF